MRRELLGGYDPAAARDDGGDASPVVRGPRAGTAEEEGVQRRQRVVALALRWWARVAVVVEKRVLVNSRRDGQVILAPRYLLGRHGDDDAVADDGARPRTTFRRRRAWRSAEPRP